MPDAILRKLAQLAARLERAKRDRDAAIRGARDSHSAAAIAKAVGLSKSRVFQIQNDEEER